MKLKSIVIENLENASVPEKIVITNNVDCLIGYLKIWQGSYFMPSELSTVILEAERWSDSLKEELDSEETTADEYLNRLAAYNEWLREISPDKRAHIVDMLTQFKWFVK